MRLIDANELEELYQKQIELGNDPQSAFENALQDMLGEHDAIDFVQAIIKTAETLPEVEILAQLAEEASELAQAALKLRRAIGVGNPTPVSVDEAIANLEEEIADVQICNAALVYADGKIKPDNIDNIMKEKTKRWLNRLTS